MGFRSFDFGNGFVDVYYYALEDSCFSPFDCRREKGSMSPLFCQIRKFLWDICGTHLLNPLFMSSKTLVAAKIIVFVPLRFRGKGVKNTVHNVENHIHATAIDLKA